MLRVPTGASWEFDRFTLLQEMRVLVSDGTPVPLMSKAFDTLVLLVENRDRVVTKDELLRVVWPDVIVEEGNLTQQIFLIRRALGDTAQQPRYIVTVPGHGYRFMARVKEIVPGSAAIDQSRHPGERLEPSGCECGSLAHVSSVAFALDRLWRDRHRHVGAGRFVAASHVSSSDRASGGDANGPTHRIERLRDWEGFAGRASSVVRVDRRRTIQPGHIRSGGRIIRPSSAHDGSG